MGRTLLFAAVEGERQDQTLLPIRVGS